MECRCQTRAVIRPSTPVYGPFPEVSNHCDKKSYTIACGMAQGAEAGRLGVRELNPRVN